MTLDINILYFLNGFVGHSAIVDGFIVLVASYFAYFIIVMFVEWLYFLPVSWGEKNYIFGVAIASAVISRFGVTEVIRFLYHRPRPFLAHTDIHNLITDNAWSFPSGHATFFFALSTAVFLYDKKWGKWFLLATVLMTLGRVAAGVHYPSDIFGGMLIGIAVAYGTYRVVENYRSSKKA